MPLQMALAQFSCGKLPYPCIIKSEYRKEGQKTMFQGLFNYDNPVWRFIGRLGDMIILNIIWVIFSLPVFTIGASTTALYYCTLKIVRDEDNGNLRMFLHSFRQNFRQATVIWLILAAVGVLLGFDLYFFRNVLKGAPTARFVFSALTSALILLWVFEMLYVWPLLSRFDNTVKNTMKNAFFLSIRYIGSTLAMLVSDGIVLFVAYISLFLWGWVTAFLLLMGFPLIAWINSTMLEHLFARFMPKEEHTDELRPILTEVSLEENTGEKKIE